MINTKYRRNVAAILQDSESRIFIAEWTEIPGIWQFPQGGVEAGETVIDALMRELAEEVGVAQEMVVPLIFRGVYKYEFPDGRLKDGEFNGQSQTYVLCRFLGNDGDIQLNKNDFLRFQWVSPSDFHLLWVPHHKVHVYTKVFLDFFGVDLAAKRSFASS